MDVTECKGIIDLKGKDAVSDSLFMSGIHKTKSVFGRLTKNFDCSNLVHQRRSLAFLFGADTLLELEHRSGLQMLLYVGITLESIKRDLKEGAKYKLLLVEPGPDAVIVPATWQNFLTFSEQLYPDFHPFFRQHFHELVSIPFLQIESKVDFRFADVETKKEEDPRYLNYGRWQLLSLVERSKLVTTRFFLYCVMHLFELFKGDGFTYDESGRRGAGEFFTLNRPISSFKSIQIIDVVVRLDSDSI